MRGYAHGRLNSIFFLFITLIFLLIIEKILKNTEIFKRYYLLYNNALSIFRGFTMQLNINELINRLEQINKFAVECLSLLYNTKENQRNIIIAPNFNRTVLPVNADLQLNNNIVSPNEKEKKSMPKFKNIHIYNKANGYFQALVSIKGYKKWFTGKVLSQVVKKAKEELAKIKLSIEEKEVKRFNEICEYWLENVKRPFISDRYYKTLLNRYKCLIKNEFNDLAVDKITPIFLQNYFKNITDKSTRNGEDVKIIINSVLEYAIGNGYITTNPMKAVIVKKHYRINGNALSKEEIELFKQKINDFPKYKIPLLVMLYTGTRESEISSVVFDFDKRSVTIKNSKLKQHQKNFYRTIPLFKQLLPYKDEILSYDFSNINFNRIGKVFKLIFPLYRLNYLRHTFQTFSRLFASKEIVNLWAGHVLGSDMTDRIYNHIPFEEQLKIADKIEF